MRQPVRENKVGGQGFTREASRDESVRACEQSGGVVKYEGEDNGSILWWRGDDGCGRQEVTVGADKRR